MKDSLQSSGIAAVTVFLLTCIMGRFAGLSWVEIGAVLGNLSMVAFVCCAVAIVIALIAKLESERGTKNQRAMMEIIMGFDPETQHVK